MCPDVCNNIIVFKTNLFKTNCKVCLRRTTVIWPDGSVYSIKTCIDYAQVSKISQTQNTIFEQDHGRLARLTDRSVARSLDRSLDRSFDRSLARSIAWLFARSLDYSIRRSLDRSLARSLDLSFNRPHDHSTARSLARSLDLSIARLPT